MEPLKTETNTRFYEFGPFVVDTERSALLRDGEIVPLGAKGFHLLLFLIQHRGQEIKKEELLKQVWAETIVEENTLARHISALRKSLDEHAGEPQYILTIPGHGYRFVAQVRERAAAETISAMQPPQNGWPGHALLTETTALPEALIEFPRELPLPPSRRRKGWLVALCSLGVIATGLALYFVRSGVPSAPPPSRKLRQLTFHPGLESEPTWSPDGNLLAYSSDRGGNFDLWVQPVGEGDPIRVTKSPAHDWQPDWSPQGNRLVYRSERDEGGLYVVPVLGGNERKIAGFGYRPHWSPDGTQVLFYSAMLRNNTNEIPKIYLVGINGETPREVLADFLQAFSFVRVNWHPDGQRLSVWGNHRQQGWGFWTVPLAGAPPIKSAFAAQVAQHIKEADLNLIEFQWSPDGRHLYFEGIAQSVRNIWKVAVEPASLRWIQGPERLTTGAGQEADLKVSPDGTKLAFTIRSEHTRLWSLPFDAATGKVAGNGQPITEADVDANFPDLSPDGQRLVFRAQRANKEELRLKSLQDGSETVLLSDDYSRQRPRWSRDGRQLAYLRLRQVNNTTERAFALLPIGGGDEQIVAFAGDAPGVAYDWSANGSQILGSIDRQRSGRLALGLFSLGSRASAAANVQIIASHPDQNLYQARFSPNDRWISFIAAKATDAGISTVYAISATEAGSEWQQITEGKYFDDKPRWGPDGRTLYFISNRTGFLNVWGIRVDPATGKAVGEPFRVTTFESPGQMILTDVRSMEMALSANRLILPVMEVSGGIWMLENVQ